MWKAWPHHTPTLIWNERSDGKSPGITCSVSHVRKKVKVQLRSSPSNECICGKSVNMILRSAAVRPPNNTHHFLNEPWCGFIFERIWRCAAEISLSKPIDGKLLTEDFIHVLNKGMHYSFIHWVTHTHTQSAHNVCLTSCFLLYWSTHPFLLLRTYSQELNKRSFHFSECEQHLLESDCLIIHR